tara:strand:- start:5027 stop:6994 length:1968 start_codon:yes stop_codon:yes gene_type:complete
LQLKQIRVQNFRSLKDVTINVGAHTALIGGNGAGKSSVLKALQAFYSTSKKLPSDDFYGRDENLEVSIELTYNQLTPLEAESFASRVRNGELVITRIFDQTASTGRYHGSVLQNSDFVPIRGLIQAGPRRDAYRDLRNNNPAYAGLPAVTSATQADDAMSAWEEANPEALELHLDDGQFFGFQNASRGALQRHTTFVFVSAVRDASIDATDGKSSAVGQLLELLVRSAIQQRQEIQAFKQEMTERYQELVSPENMPELGVLADNLTRDLRNLYEDATVGMDWRAVEEFPVPLPMADVELSDDGFGAPVDRQGHGLQRAFIFTILQHLARSTVLAGNEVEEEEPEGEQTPVPQLILAIEEPELYQHPTKQRHLADVLRGLSNGTLPGADARTQILFATHSPFFVSLGHADEIRLARKIAIEECEFKICDLQSLSLDAAATRLEAAWQKDPGTFTGATLMPRLHILGAELSEGYFAQGVILVEGRSDKAALEAAARILNVNFASAGIAILSAEGKENLDRPYVIFTELGVPVYTIWDCDGHKNANNAHPATNLALARLCDPTGDIEEAPTETTVEASYTHFQDSLERTLKSEIGEAELQQYLQAACAPLELPANGETQKIPEVMFQTLSLARENGKESAILNSIVQRAWTHLTGQNL